MAEPVLVYQPGNEVAFGPPLYNTGGDDWRYMYVGLNHPDGPQDLHVEGGDPCWVIHEELFSPWPVNSAAYFEENDLVVNVQFNDAWLNPPDRSFVDGDGMLYGSKHILPPSGFWVERYELRVRQITQAGVRTDTTFDIQSLAPAGPPGYPNFDSGQYVSMYPQDSGIIVDCQWTWDDGGGPPTTITRYGFVVIESDLTTNAYRVDEDITDWEVVAWLADGVIANFKRAGVKKTATIVSTGSIVTEVARIDLPHLIGSGWFLHPYFIDDGSFFTASSATNGYRQYNSVLVDVAPLWLQTISDAVEHNKLIVNSKGTRFAFLTDGDQPTRYRYRVYNNAGEILLNVDGSDGVTLHGFPPAHQGSSTGKTQQTMDNRITFQTKESPWPFGERPTSRILKYSLDAVLMTRRIAETPNASFAMGTMDHYTRGQFQQFTYAGWV